MKTYQSLFLCALLAVSQLTNANENTQIKLDEGGFFKPATYSINNGEKKPTAGAIGLNDHFIEAFNDNPQAYKAIKQTDTYAKFSVLGLGIVTVGSALLLADSLKQADEVNNGKLPEDDSSGQETALTVVVVGAVVTVVAAQLAKSKLRKALSLYNNKQLSRIGSDQIGFMVSNNSLIDFNFNPGFIHNKHWNMQASYQYLF